jgi:protocadherin-16/23
VEEEVDVEIQMINEGNLSTMNDTCLNEDSVSDISVQNGKEYLARLGIDTRAPHLVNSYQTLEGDIIRSDISSMVYNRLQEDALSDKNSMVSGGASAVYARTGHPVSMTGSLSSIVHSEEEIAGSYNWDYLLDWGPQYQPLAHVFQEISTLKDECHAPAPPSGHLENRAPPILTCRPPRHVHTIQSNSSHPARSPISHEMLSQSAMSPSFSPALSPLATRSPSISPLGGPVRQGMVRGNINQSHYQASLPSDYGDNTEKEMRI